MSGEADRAAARVAREHYGRLVAFLTARTGDVASAEDALGEAFAAALAAWPSEGVPDNPAAWLLTVARRRHTDSLRRQTTRSAALPRLELLSEELESLAASQAIPDRRLALMFACAHPAIDRAVRAPLILQTLFGLAAHEIAPAFLLPPKTLGQRLVRAKLRIRDAGIPLEVPDRGELPDRLGAVLDAIYAAYTKGWSEDAPSGLSAFADEAMWLGELLVRLLPEQPEAKGMLALMRYTAARRHARRDAAGAFVPLERQDTRRWDVALLRSAERLLGEANRQGPTGRYQLEAAIQSAHVARRLSGVPNWPAVVALYEHLFQRTRSPVVALNRAVARAEVDGPHAALTELAALEADARMASYQPLWSAKGHLAARAGDLASAIEALTIAIGLTTDPATREYLVGRVAALRASPPRADR